MSVKKAIKIIDWWINQKKESMEELTRTWNFTSDCEGVGKILLDSDKTMINNLEIIRKELVPNCTHPKEMRDCCAGQWYCMNCNLDL